MPELHHASEGDIRRFGWYRIMEHHLGAATFIVLVITGLSQKFYEQPWAGSVVDAVGGIDALRLVHRGFGVVFVLFLAQHLGVAFYGVLWRGWSPSMLVTLKDFVDAVQNLRYYLGLSDQPARCDRYDYKQKFEYWGVILGGIAIAGTGLMLWFPTLAFQWIPFLPGQLLPAALEVHTNEAMLALLVIAIWHIYNAVFSPEVFPVDTVIFTGRISRERMRHEHPLELERLSSESQGEYRSSPR